jgi:hypothetical protein
VLVQRDLEDGVTPKRRVPDVRHREQNGLTSFAADRNVRARKAQPSRVDGLTQSRVIT